MLHDRRLGVRVPLDMLFTQYHRDRPLRALAANVSDSGLSAQVVTLPWCSERIPTVALEFTLPGTDEIIWARGEVRYQRTKAISCGGVLYRAGVRFTAMARRHAVLVRDYCLERRRRTLTNLLARVAAE